MADFQQIQHQFTAHLRAPEDHPPPSGIETRRMAIYADLLFNNILGFISNGYPVLRTLFSDQAWHTLVREFFSSHDCKTPYFARISEEFLAFLQSTPARPDAPPFLLELAHYEWVELALSISEANLDDEPYRPHGDLLESLPVVSPLAWTLVYEWPVHTLSEDNQPATAPETPTYLVVWRDRSDKVGFCEINAVSARLLQLIQEGNVASGREALSQIATELGMADSSAIEDAGRQILTKLRHQEIILGVAP